MCIGREAAPEKRGGREARRGTDKGRNAGADLVRVRHVRACMVETPLLT